MQILSHRGYWKTASEKNSPAAFARSFASGFGTETDLRDALGAVVISHDVPATDALSANVLFDIYRGIGSKLPLALNVKSDGLQLLLRPMLDLHAVSNYFLFDMSVPDALVYIKHGFHVFTRQSEYEPEPAFYREASGVWMDCFLSEWMDETAIARHLDGGKRVCLVSPDLHKRDHEPFWARLAEMNVLANPNLMLCTDLPDSAKSFFHV